MTLAEILIVVATELGDDFTKEDLAIAAWERFPQSFGMSGGTYPDTQKVYAMLSHTSGPVRKGLMRLHPKLAVTNAGRVRAAQTILAEQPVVSTPAPQSRRWDGKTDWHKARLEDAMEFFGLTFAEVHTGTSAEKIRARLAALRAVEGPEGNWNYNLADFLIEKFGSVLAPGEKFS